ncbi:MAG: hypothetical protein WEA81_07930 [Dehalococcoidia bacterium]
MGAPEGDIVLKSFIVGVGAGFLGLAGAAIIPIIIGVLWAVGGAATVLGLYAWRTFRKLRRAREAAAMSVPGASALTSTSQSPAAPVAGHAQWDVRS